MVFERISPRAGAHRRNAVRSPIAPITDHRQRCSSPGCFNDPVAGLKVCAGCAAADDGPSAA